MEAIHSFPDALNVGVARCFLLIWERGFPLSRMMWDCVMFDLFYQGVCILITFDTPMPGIDWRVEVLC